MERTEEGRDLIETLWNVKIKKEDFENRDDLDLIETLWNLKFILPPLRTAIQM